MKKILATALLATMIIAPAAQARFIRGSADCPALTVDQAISEIAEGTYGPMVQTECFSALTGRTGQCSTSIEQYRDVIATVAKTADYANDEVNMAVYQYARTDIGYGVLVDYREASCGRFVWDLK